MPNSKPPPQPFYGPYSGTTQMSQCQKRTSGLDFMVQGRLMEADTLTIPLGGTASGLTGV